MTSGGEIGGGFDAQERRPQPEAGVAAKRWTPGPWIRSGCRQKVAGSDTHSVVATVDGKDIIIASVWYNPETHDGFHDANLMAASRDLIALAQNLERWLLKDAEPSHVGADDMRVYRLDGGILGNLLNEARAAIAKAEGRS